MIYTNPNESAEYKVKEQYSNFIDGSWTEPQEGEFLIIFRQLLVKIIQKFLGLHKDVDLAVKAAKSTS